MPFLSTLHPLLAPLPPKLILHGIIPAYAGSTIASSIKQGAARDHPRACGEHSAPASGGVGNLGSSPRMRGALASSGPVMIQGGIIPAHAGSTGYVSLASSPSRDHPRACGEHTKNPSSESRNPIIELHFNQFAKKVKRCFTIRFSPMRCFVVKVQ